MNIKAKIDVKKIDKGALYAGQKGTYLDVVLIEKQNEHSDGFIVQEISKERREAGERGAILGNWSYLKPKPENLPQPGTAEIAPVIEPKDDLPF